MLLHRTQEHGTQRGGTPLRGIITAAAGACAVRPARRGGKERHDRARCNEDGCRDIHPRGDGGCGGVSAAVAGRLNRHAPPGRAAKVRQPQRHHRKPHGHPHAVGRGRRRARARAVGRASFRRRAGLTRGTRKHGLRPACNPPRRTRPTSLPRGGYHGSTCRSMQHIALRNRGLRGEYLHRIHASAHSAEAWHPACGLRLTGVVCVAYGRGGC